MVAAPVHWVRMVLGLLVAVGVASPLIAGKKERRETQVLRLVATQSLEENIQHLASGDYVSAGAHQFKSLWTRDFAYRVRGLLLLGRDDIVRRQIEVTLRHRRESDGVLPKGLDNFPHNERSAYFSLKRLLPFLDDNLVLAEPLVPIYEDQNQSLAIDSNVLIVHAALDYLAHSGDRQWWEQVEPQLVQAFRYYDRFKVDGLIKQEPFSDWQDTVARPGFAFLTNLLYYKVCRSLVAHPQFQVTAEQVADLYQRLLATFRPDPRKPFTSFNLGPYVTTDGNLLALDFDLFPPGSPEAVALYQALKAHPLWHQKGKIPGRVSYPVYQVDWKPWYVVLVGLGPYHDELYWSWLMGLAGKIAYKMGDREHGDKIFSRLAQLASRDQWIYEVYENRSKLQLFASALVESEGPFSWGASFMLDMVDYVCRNEMRDC